MLLLFVLTLSVDVLVDIGIDGLNRRDHLQLVLLTWLLCPSLAAVYLQLPAKLLLFAAPAMAILVARRMEERRSRVFPAAYLSLVVLACALLSISIMRADRALSDIGKAAGSVVAANVQTGMNVWADGAWGFQWYAMEAGAKPLARTAPFPASGDIIVASLQGFSVPESYHSAKLVSRQIFNTPGGRIDGDGAGFYTNLHGPLPWVWGTGEIGRIEVWRLDSSK
jgi:hypothetical protein